MSDFIEIGRNILFVGLYLVVGCDVVEPASQVGVGENEALDSASGGSDHAELGSSSGGAAFNDAPSSGGSQQVEGAETGGAPTFDDVTLACPRYVAATSVGIVSASEIDEASGLVQSRAQANLLWTHNDSGDFSRIFGLDLTGQLLATVTIANTSAIDWEDIAMGPGPEPNVDYLYIGDIGDNHYERSSVQVYRLREPTVPRGDGPVLLSSEDADVIELVYPNGPENAETLLIDPWSGDLVIVGKSSDGVSAVYRANAPLTPDSPTILEHVTTLAFGVQPLVGDGLTTGGDISASGHLVAIRTYSHVVVWIRQEGEDLIDALASPPCAVEPIAEPQGEALALSVDGSGYFSLSEQPNQPLLFIGQQP